MVLVEMFTTAFIESFSMELKDKISFLPLGSLCVGFLGAFLNVMLADIKGTNKRVDRIKVFNIRFIFM